MTTVSPPPVVVANLQYKLACQMGVRKANHRIQAESNNDSSPLHTENAPLLPKKQKQNNKEKKVDNNDKYSNNNNNDCSSMFSVSRWTFSVCLFVLAASSSNRLITSVEAAASSDDKCSSAANYACPYYSELCQETVYVDDCLDCEGYRNTDSYNDVCFARKLLNAKDNPHASYLWKDLVGMVVWFCAAGVATACGVGGGGIYVPLGILLLSFAPKPASGLSQASIFGASLGGLLLNTRNKHPLTTKIVVTNASGGSSFNTSTASSIPTGDGHANNNNSNNNTNNTTYYTRPLIDYDMALFLAPMEMAGAVLGVLIQTILPNWLYLTLAAIILGFTAYKTYLKFFDARKKELASRDYNNNDDNNSNDPQERLLDDEHDHDDEHHNHSHHSNNNNNNDSSIHDIHKDEVTKSPSLSKPSPKKMETEETDLNEEDEEQNIAATATEGSAFSDDERLERRTYWLERDSRQFPTDKVIGLLILWIGLVLLTFLKGGKGVDSLVGIDCTSPWYAVLIVIQFVWTLGIAAFFGYSLTIKTQDKQACGYPWHPQDILWDFQKVRFYAFFTFIAGIVAGLIGIGGGMVLGPLMLVMGIDPRVSSATTATMIVLTSSSVAVLFVTAGLIPWEYALSFFSVCLVGAYVGKTKIDSYVKKTGKASLLIFLLATIIALATIGCIVIALTRLAEANWCFAGFNKFCTVSDDDSDADICPIDRMLFGEASSS